MVHDSKLNIFVSRPLDVSEPWVKAFETRLNDLGMVPRTVGVGREISNRAPLESVCKLMRSCQGAIIFGHPSDPTFLEEGPRRAEVRDARTSEWNHIEAGIAYALNLPLLVIADNTVGGGIFEKGAGNVFVHQVNLLSTDWLLSETISGALAKLKSDIVEPENLRSIVAIHEPFESAKVDQECVVSGTGPSKAEVWVIVHPVGDHRYWVQGRSYTETGAWRVVSHFGLPHWNHGQVYEIRAVVAPNLELHAGAELNHWPKGSYWSRTRFVIRR